MTTAPDGCERFVPSEVEGLPGVTETIVFPNRLELMTADRRVVIRFLDIARWNRFGGLFRWTARFGWGVRGRPVVADRDWFHLRPGPFFRFYTDPAITIYLPDECPNTPYGQTLFRRVQEVMAAGGFGTVDVG
jgi:hypothetical protein